MDEKTFYDMLCCPTCKGDLTRNVENQELHCSPCSFYFPIVDGIPVLFPMNVKEEFNSLFNRYWDSEEKAKIYNENVEGGATIFGIYNHEAEIDALVSHYDKSKLDIVLDAGCGNGRFMETLPAESVKIGLDASLNLLRFVKKRKRGDFLVCGELEHIPFKDNVFSTVISCRVLQHLTKQEEACQEMVRVARDDGDIILELYNSWNLKTIYKTIRMSPRLSKIFNAPFRAIFRSLSPFEDWGLAYDRYNNWYEAKGWMNRAQLAKISGRGTGFGIHKYLVDPFYGNAIMEKHAPNLLKGYYRFMFAWEKMVGGLPIFRQTMEKFVIKGTKSETPTLGFTGKVIKTLQHNYKTSSFYNAAALRELRRERDSRDVVAHDNRFHLREALEWLKRAQDAIPDRGVARGYSVGWTNARGWQPSYPETTGYIIPSMFDCAALLEDDSLHARTLEMADWEIEVQMPNGAVMGGVLNRNPTPAVFNTGQVMLGWLRAHQESGITRYLEAARRAADFLLSVQDQDGAWRRGNSEFALPITPTYNSRVGLALILFGQRVGEEAYVEAGVRNMSYTLTQQSENGWFRSNCLSDPKAPLLHTICYAIEGLLGAYQALGTAEYLEAAKLSAESLIPQVSADGQIAGRFDAAWRGTVDWSCLTGCAQLAVILFKLHGITGEDRYQETGELVLWFLKRTQNCVSEDGGLRGGIKGSYPFDGDYGRYEILNWATKFYIDALILAETA